MVFVSLSAIAEDFGITLRAVSWVIIAQALTISALMLPMGRFADIVGWKRVHLGGLLLFGGGALFTAFSPTFGILIVARIVMAAGNAMGQSVGTAMVVSIFPPQERGVAIGSQTTAVAIGAASGPIFGGLILQVLPWEALFIMLLVPSAIAFVAGYLILDEREMQRENQSAGATFDWGGAILSGLAIVVLVITVNNPLGVSWSSPLALGSLLGAAILLAWFIRWELGSPDPMLELRLFQNSVFRLAVLTRFLGFMGTTAAWFMTPIYLISLRGIAEGTAGGVLFLTSLGMGIAAQAAGRLSDRFEPRPIIALGFAVLAVTSLPMAFLTHETPVLWVMVLLFANGLGMGLWNVPNNSMVLGSVPASNLGVVAAFTNLTRNVGNVAGQAMAAGIVVAVMVSRGFDVPLDQVADDSGAGDAFMAGWRASFLLVAALMAICFALSLRAKRLETEAELPATDPSDAQVAHEGSS